MSPPNHPRNPPIQPLPSLTEWTKDFLENVFETTTKAGIEVAFDKAISRNISPILVNGQYFTRGQLKEQLSRGVASNAGPGSVKIMCMMVKNIDGFRSGPSGSRVVGVVNVFFQVAPRAQGTLPAGDEERSDETYSLSLTIVEEQSFHADETSATTTSSPKVSAWNLMSTSLGAGKDMEIFTLSVSEGGLGEGNYGRYLNSPSASSCLVM